MGIVLSHPSREKQKRGEGGDPYPYTIRENALVPVVIIAVVVSIIAMVVTIFLEMAEG
ncbi:MAG: hypothetical protein ABSG62_21965 [Terracidiphilus sp.]